MQGTIAFTGADINIDGIEFQMHGVEDNGSQDSAVDFGQILRAEVNGFFDLGFIQVEYQAFVPVEFFDDGQRRYSDYTHALGVHVRCPRAVAGKCRSSQ
jgi:hypothetical protein